MLRHTLVPLPRQSPNGRVGILIRISYTTTRSHANLDPIVALVGDWGPHSLGASIVVIYIGTTIASIITIYIGGWSLAPANGLRVRSQGTNGLVRTQLVPISGPAVRCAIVVPILAVVRLDGGGAKVNGLQAGAARPSPFAIEGPRTIFQGGFPNDSIVELFLCQFLLGLRLCRLVELSLAQLATIGMHHALSVHVKIPRLGLATKHKPRNLLGGHAPLLRTLSHESIPIQIQILVAGIGHAIAHLDPHLTTFVLG
mmetsp:Transcript_4037/g.9137  ORF Transcript_4037/g.9137 Transcript_4037/m.9137 type:complete len:256 (+) Transcript_4037:515-1282(+)